MKKKKKMMMMMIIIIINAALHVVNLIGYNKWPLNTLTKVRKLYYNTINH
jgi:hypothetical protein